MILHSRAKKDNFARKKICDSYVLLRAMKKKRREMKRKMVDFGSVFERVEKKIGKQCTGTKKEIILRRCEQWDADGVCGNDGGDAFDTDSQHVYKFTTPNWFIRKFIIVAVDFFPFHFMHIHIMIMMCTCEKGDAQTRSVGDTPSVVY